MAMTVKKDNNEVRIQWRVADIKIPTNEIKNVSQDQNIHAVPKLDRDKVSRIGSTFGKTNQCYHRYCMTMNTLFIHKMTKKYMTKSQNNI
jgi:hypothetical protein